MIDLDLLLKEDESGNSFYRTSFFEIHLSCPFSKTLDDLGPERLGLFVHEYIHYLQNISTPWGLYSSIITYGGVIEQLKSLKSAEEIKIPFSCEYSNEHMRMVEIFKLGEGDVDFKELYFKQVDLSESFSICVEGINCNGKIVNTLNCYFTDSTGVQRKIVVGAKIIRESMAFMYQKLFHEDAVTKHDVPYNLIKIICSVRFKNIAEDPKKLITICYLSLFSNNPGQALLDLLFYANNNPDISGLKLVDYYLANYSSTDSERNKMSMIELSDKLTDDLLDVLERLIPGGTHFLAISINAARLSNGFMPPVNVLYGEEEHMDVERVKALTSYLGLPYLTDSIHSLYLNSIEGDVVQTPNDVLYMRMISLVLDMLTKIRERSHCPALKHECDGSVKEDFECLSNPWDGNECAFTGALKIMGINKDNIHW